MTPLSRAPRRLWRQALGVTLVNNSPDRRACGAMITRGPARMPKSISACSQAILSHFQMNAESLIGAQSGAIEGDELRVIEVNVEADHLSMTLRLPMMHMASEMTVNTIGAASISMPGLRLSPAIAAACIGQPIGRMTGHRAFETLHHLTVANVQECFDPLGRCTTVLTFDDHAEPFVGGTHGHTACSVQ